MRRGPPTLRRQLSAVGCERFAQAVSSPAALCPQVTRKASLVVIKILWNTIRIGARQAE